MPISTNDTLGSSRQEILASAKVFPSDLRAQQNLQLLPIADALVAIADSLELIADSLKNPSTTPSPLP